jgi:hypothetical protein
MLEVLRVQCIGGVARDYARVSEGGGEGGWEGTGKGDSKGTRGVGTAGKR